MANDRLSIKCAYCPQRLTLAKYYPSADLSLFPSAETLSDFLRDHHMCRPDPYAPDWGDEPGFVLLTEALEAALKGE